PPRARRGSSRRAPPRRGSRSPPRPAPPPACAPRARRSARPRRAATGSARPVPAPEASPPRPSDRADGYPPPRRRRGRGRYEPAPGGEVRLAPREPRHQRADAGGRPPGSPRERHRPDERADPAPHRDEDGGLALEPPVRNEAPTRVHVRGAHRLRPDRALASTDFLSAF